jgi:hypothetical protein
VPRPTLTMFYKILWTSKAPVVTQVDRDSTLDDLRYWRAAVVVLDPHEHAADLMRRTMTDLVGFGPQMVGGVWLWDVRALTAV